MVEVTGFVDTTVGDEYRAVVVEVGGKTVDLTRMEVAVLVDSLTKAASRVWPESTPVM